MANNKLDEDTKLSDLSKELKENWAKYTHPPKAKDNKFYLFFCILFWPISLIEYFLADAIKKASDLLYKSLGFVYDKIPELVLGKL